MVGFFCVNVICKPHMLLAALHTPSWLMWLIMWFSHKDAMILIYRNPWPMISDYLVQLPYNMQLERWTCWHLLFVLQAQEVGWFSRAARISGEMMSCPESLLKSDNNQNQSWCFARMLVTLLCSISGKVWMLWMQISNTILYSHPDKGIYASLLLHDERSPFCAHLKLHLIKRNT